MAHPLVEGVLRQDVRATARACRVCDDRRPGYLELLRGLFPQTGKAFRVGVTGNPGAGKSTLVDRLIEAYRGQGKRVAALAVDPTSPFSGGAILGDRIRMQRHFEDPMVFIRSVATRGALGGLSRSTWDVTQVLDAWGADVIVIETVGVGQDELEIAKGAHSTLVVVPPGLGDDVQASKAGLLECADVFAVNKADREGADSTVRDLEAMIALGGEIASAGAHSRSHAAGHLDVARERVRHREGAWVPPVIKSVATKREGVDAIVTALDAHRAWLATPAGVARWQARQAELFRALLRDAMLERLELRLGPTIEGLVERVMRRELDPYAAGDEALEALYRLGP
jgi:LAO/AO transport system kinase